MDSANYASTTFPPPRPFQAAAHEALREGIKAGHRKQLIMSPTGSGKCLGRDTPVLMADGSARAVQDVRQGEFLMGPDGTARRVVSIASGWEMLWRVTPIKGDSYVVNESHILSLRKTPGSGGISLADGSKVASDADVVNINVRTFAESSKTARHCLKGWRSDRIPMFACGGMRDRQPMPAYLLGVWLGDGTVGHPQITKPDCAMVREWCDFGRSHGLRVVERDSERCPTWALVGERGGAIGRTNPVTDMLKACGVYHDKHIPDAYKYGYGYLRADLLAGLIDSDGHITHGGCDWISRSERMANDFAFICRSLGLACYVSKQRKGIKSTGFESDYWRCSVSGDLSVIPMRDKKADARTQKKRHLVHGIKVEPIGEGEYFGFEIEGPDRLFLLGDFTATHNTYLGMRIIHESLAKGRRALFVADRRTLIEQTSAVADAYGLSAHGVVMADHWRRRSSMPFQIASVQTLARRNWPDADVIVIDECHVQAKAWVDHVKTTRAAVIGLSATPFSDGLGQIFTNLVNAATMAELTESGVLVPMRVFSCVKPDMRGAATRGGEWTEKAAEERGMEILGDVVAEWSKYASDRKTIVFGSTIDHCSAICQAFNEAGVLAAMFTSKTTQAERDALLTEYRKPDSAIRVLISVEALAKGFDVPDVGAVVDCRPLRKSLSTAIQMWGRGLRSAPGKTDCLLLDHSGNIIRFRKDFEDIYHNGLAALDMGEKLDKTVRKDEEDREPRPCPKCGYTPFARRCVACGFELVRPDTVAHEAGEMVEVMIGKSKAAENRADLWAQCVTYVRGHGKPETAKGRAAHLYKDIVGGWPPRNFDMAAPSVPISKAVLNKIRSRQIAWSKRAAA